VSSFDEADVLGRNENLDVNIDLWIDPPIRYSRLKNEDPAEIRQLSFQYTHYQVGEKKGERRLEQKCFTGDGKPPMLLAKAPKTGEKHQYQPLVNIPSEVRECVPLIYIGTNRSLKEHLPGGRYSLLRRLFEDINKDLHDPTQTIRLKRADGSEVEVPRAERFYKLMEAALKLLRTEEFEKLEASIKRNALRQLGFDPDVDTDKLDLFFSPFDTMEFYKSLDLIVREGEFTISATELGEGLQNALVLAILQAYEERRKKGAVILLEEPEMFLHPQMQRSLYKTLREIGQTNQVIYATHSPHFVTVPDYDEVLLVRKGAEGTSVCRSDLPSNAKRREKLIKELDPERNELFFASRLLVVEGDTEKLALPEYAKRLNLDLDREGATIVEVGGKRNLLEFATIAASFQIPVGILYDEDSSDFKTNREEEKTFNAQLDTFQKNDGSQQVWRCTKNYEDELRKTLGEKQYLEFCQKYPEAGKSKPIRARLIATETGTPVPKPISEALTWLTNKQPAAKPQP
jgi:energy-coupling factor transporter ATP-binding protein EcfA2